MKKITVFLLVVAGLTTPAWGDEIKSNIGVVSDFVFRGISQTDNGPAVQGGADLYLDNGWYAGAWASTMDRPLSDAKARVDLYGGYGAKWGQGVRWDVGAKVYTFIADSDLNFFEIYGGVALGPLSARLSLDPDDENSYIEAAWRQDIGSGVNLNLHVGQSLLDQARDYLDAAVGVSKVFSGLEVGLTVTDTTQKPRSDHNDTILFLSGKYAF